MKLLWLLHITWMISLVQCDVQSLYIDLDMFVSKMLNIEKANDYLQSVLATDDNLCFKDIKVYMDSLTNGENWAVRMFDATGKPSSGLMEGQMRWLGDFDQCLAIKPTATDGSSRQFGANYCNVQFKVHKAAFPSINSPIIPKINMMLGVCLPSTCSTSDFRLLSEALFRLIPGLNGTNVQQPTQATCNEPFIWTSQAIAAVVVCLVIFIIMIFGTIIDIRQRYEKAEREAIVSFYEKGQLDNNCNGQVVTENGAIPDTGETTVNTPKSGTLCRVLLAFSVYTNTLKIVNTSRSAGTISSIHGFRFFCIVWIILGHTFVAVLECSGNSIPFYRDVVEKRLSFQFIDNETFVVDSFFVLSGLLVSYLKLQDMKKNGRTSKFNFKLFYFHRYWRLTPPYMLWYMVYVCTSAYWFSGPLWSQTGLIPPKCTGSWWKNMLYVNNFLEPTVQCKPTSWFLAVDMQFYILAPLMLIPLFTSMYMGLAVCGAFLSVAAVISGSLAIKHNFNPNEFQDTRYTQHFANYMMPWGHCGSYVVGILTGYIMYRTDCKLKLSKIVNISLWILATIACCLMLFGLYDPINGQPGSNMGRLSTILYICLSRTVWSAGMAWFIFACATGNGGPINKLLSWPALIPFSRLSYCAYLVHVEVVKLDVMSSLSVPHASVHHFVYRYFGNLIATFILAFIVSLAFEVPMIELERILFRRPATPKKPQNGRH